MLKQRVVTGLVLIVVAFVAIFWLPVAVFSICFALVIMFGAWEWANLAGVENSILRVGYAVVVGCVCFLVNYLSMSVVPFLIAASIWWCFVFLMVKNYPSSAEWCSGTIVKLLMGVVTLFPAWLAMDLLKSRFESVEIILVLLFVWAADVGAYFIGKNFGQHLLAVNVSPQKTIEGFLGGVVSSVFIAIIIGLALNVSFAKGLGLILLSIIIAFMSVVGDLLESLLKRERGVKDSSKLLPGHGGILDRIDSLTAALPIYALVLIASGG